MKATIRSGLFLAISLIVSGAQAQQVKQYSVSDFFKNSDFAALRLSPNGEWMAAIGPYEGRRNLFTMRLSDRKAARLTSLTSKGREDYNRDIAFFFWANDERLIFGVDADGNESFSLYAVNRDGTEQRELFKGDRGIVLFATYTRLLDRLRDDPDHILVTNNERNKFYPDVFRLNIHNGRMARVETNPGYFQGWMTDWDGNVRFAVGHPDSRGRALEDGELLRQLSYYRPAPDAEWQVVHTTHEFDGPVFRPVAFTADNKSLYVATNEGRDTTALYTFDPETGQLGELIVADDRADIGAVIGHDQLAQLTGFGVEGVQGRGVATLVRGHVQGLVVGGKRHRPENRAVEFMRGVHHLPFGIRRRPVVGQLAQQFAVLQRPPPAVRVPYRKSHVAIPVRHPALEVTGVGLHPGHPPVVDVQAEHVGIELVAFVVGYQDMVRIVT